MNYFAHETAVIDPGAKIGSDTKIWHFSHICAQATLGQSCVLGQGVYVDNQVSIGNRVKIQNGVSVYARVTLEDEVFCGPSVVFTNVTNPRAAIERKNEFKPTLVRQGATLGANCTILCGVTIGRYAFIGAGAVVLRDVPDYAIFVGNPAHQLGWMGEHGVRLDAESSEERFWRCPATKKRYELKNGLMRAE